MWALTNHTPYPGIGRPIVGMNGERQWLVTLRGTFHIAPSGELVRADEQPPPLLVPKYRGAPGKSSLVREADADAEKPGVDIVVTGSAYAPKGRPVPQVPIGIVTGAFRKILTVIGDRVWKRNRIGWLRPTSAEPFLRMPLVYERAYGGFAPARAGGPPKMFAANPVGVGFGPRKAGQQLPNIAPAEATVAAPPIVAGLGPLDRYWEPRVRYAGTYDAEWARTRRPLLPPDFNPRFFHAAPHDQQLDANYNGGDRIEIVNMTPEGLLSFFVPRLVFGLSTYFRRGVARHCEYHRSALRTVAIDTEARTVSLTWQSTLSCHEAFPYLEETVIREKARIT